MDIKECMELLEIKSEEGMNEKIIKKAYKNKVKTSHPDKNKTSDAGDLFNKATDARDKLLEFVKTPNGTRAERLTGTRTEDSDIDADFDGLLSEGEIETDIVEFAEFMGERSAKLPDSNKKLAVIDNAAPFIAHKKCTISVSFEDAYYGNEQEIILKIRNLSMFRQKTFTINAASSQKIWYQEGDLLDSNKLAGNVCIRTRIKDLPANVVIDEGNIIYYYPVSLYEFLYVKYFEISFMGELYPINRDPLPVNTDEVVLINDGTAKYSIPGKGMLHANFKNRGDLIVYLNIMLLSSTLVDIHKNLEEFFPPLLRK